MTDIIPLSSLAGGILIGTAAVLLMLLHGRIAGVTGILSGLFPPYQTNQWAWRFAFLIGMATSPAFYIAATGSSPALQSLGSPAVLLLSGFTVGIGVTFGSGCTSGHGVCGLSRLSTRSAAAVATFMATAVVTVFVTRHVL